MLRQEVDGTKEARRLTGIAELDRVLGGGWCRARSCCSAETPARKSTLLLSMMDRLTRDRPGLSVSGKTTKPSPLRATMTEPAQQARAVAVPGHGWLDKDGNAIAALSDFFVTIARFWSFRGERRGGSERSQSLHDLDTVPAAYNLILVEREPPRRRLNSHRACFSCSTKSANA